MYKLILNALPFKLDSINETDFMKDFITEIRINGGKEFEF
jgi:hypothetical protein